MKHIKSLLITTLITTNALGYTLPGYEYPQDVVADGWILPGKTTTGVTQDFTFLKKPFSEEIQSTLNPKKMNEESIKKLCSLMENSQVDVRIRFFSAKKVFSYIKDFPELKENDAHKESALNFLSSVASLEIPSNCFEAAHSLPKRAKQLLEKFTSSPESGSNSNTNYVTKKSNYQETKTPARQTEKREEETLGRKALRALEDSTTSDYDRLKFATLLLNSSPDTLERNLAMKNLLKLVEDNTASNDKIRNARELINLRGEYFHIKQLNEIIKIQNKNKKVQYNYK